MNTKVILACVGSALVGAVVGLGIGKMTGGDQGGGGPVAVPSGGGGSLAGRPGPSVGMEGAELTNPAITYRELRWLGEKGGFDDPIAAIESANDIPGTDNRDVFLESVYTSWGEKDGQAAALWAMDNLKGYAKSDALYYIADGWAESDPAGAASWFNENTTGEILEDGMWEILEAWGRKSPAEAFAWKDNLDEYTQSAIMDGLAEGWGAVDPRAAAEAGMTLQDRDYGDEFVMSVMTQWAGSNPKEAAEWAANVQEEGLKATVYMELGAEWAITDPEAATAWVSAVEDAEAKKIAEVGIALGWSEHDPGGAMDWAVNSLTDAQHTERVIEEIMLSWTDTDPNGAGNWLNARQKGPQTDSILTTFSGSIIDLDPIAAITWAGEISDEAKRTTHMKELLGEWVAMDGEYARQEIRKMEIAPELKEEFGKAP